MVIRIREERIALHCITLHCNALLEFPIGWVGLGRAGQGRPMYLRSLVPPPSSSTTPLYAVLVVAVSFSFPSSSSPLLGRSHRMAWHDERILKYTYTYFYFLLALALTVII